MIVADAFASAIPQLVRSRTQRIRRSNASLRAFKACKKHFKHLLTLTRHQRAASNKKLVDLYEAHLEAKLREIHEQYTLASGILRDSFLPSRLLRPAAAYRSIHHRAIYRLMARLSQLKKRKVALAESLAGIDSKDVASWIQSFLARPVAEISHQGQDDTREVDRYGWRETNREDQVQRDVRTLAIHRLGHGKERKCMKKINGERWPTYKQFWCPLSQRWFAKITGAHIVPARVSQNVVDALVGRGFDLKGPENCFPMVQEWEEHWARNKFALVQIKGTGIAHDTPEEYKIVVFGKTLLDGSPLRIGTQKTWRQYDGMKIEFLADRRPSKVLMYVRYVTQMFWCREQGRKYNWLFSAEGSDVRWTADEQLLYGSFVRDAARWMRDSSVLELLGSGECDEDMKGEDGSTSLSDEEVITDELLLDFHMAKTSPVMIYDGFADVNTLVDVQY